MHIKVFYDTDRISLRNKIKVFRTNPKVSIMNVKYDINYRTKEYRASVLYKDEIFLKGLEA